MVPCTLSIGDNGVFGQLFQLRTNLSDRKCLTLHDGFIGVTGEGNV